MSERAHRRARAVVSMTTLMMEHWSPRVVLFSALGVWNAIAGSHFFGGWWIDFERCARVGGGLVALWIAQDFWWNGG